MSDLERARQDIADIEERAWNVIRAMAMQNNAVMPIKGSLEYETLRVGIWAGITAYQQQKLGE